ncbi:Cupin 2 conserved barrel [Penicillium atrosanguineum]|nr:Cupin 2 conserved barrel [Penicillium atrosanguineum]KAJ5296487.1 Cupin 2 conserved barrel [Penicillium atrosanguineum]
MSTLTKLQRRTVGPLDKRRRVTRCLGCAKRRIKCEGGAPCAHCTRQNTMCVPQKQSERGVSIFVNQTRQGDLGGCHKTSDQKKMAITNKRNSGNDQIHSIGRDRGTRLLDYFVSFIQQNLFTMSFSSIVPELLPLISTSPLLYHAVIAVGGLDANRHSAGRALQGEKPPYVDAMTSYRTSMSILRSCLGEINVVQREDVLWATFFLGLFELLSDDSGEGWVKHMLHGTSKMLQLTGPSSCMSSPRRIFYDLFRVLEASRALLYNEETILSQECWLRLQKTLSSEETRWDPMEEIITLMIQTSAFSLRAHDIIENISEPERFTNLSVALLAAEGLMVQENIYNWHAKTLLQLFQDDTNEYLNLALLYYHALLIFLSGNYDYFPYWDKLQAPVLSPSEVSDHLVAILDLSADVLLHSKIPGVMLFFPVTVAGSRARSVNQKSKVLNLLDQVFCKGFVVANRVRDGLLIRWAERDQKASIQPYEIRNT